jgi:hypothetical protein
MIRRHLVIRHSQCVCTAVARSLFLFAMWIFGRNVHPARVLTMLYMLPAVIEDLACRLNLTPLDLRPPGHRTGPGSASFHRKPLGWFPLECGLRFRPIEDLASHRLLSRL